MQNFYHTGDKLYWCHNYGKGFSNNGNLQTHCVYTMMINVTNVSTVEKDLVKYNTAKLLLYIIKLLELLCN